MRSHILWCISTFTPLEDHDDVTMLTAEQHVLTVTDHGSERSVCSAHSVGDFIEVPNETISNVVAHCWLPAQI